MSFITPLWPPAASEYAQQVDRLFLGFSALTLLLVLPVFILIGIFALKYRRGRDVDRTHRKGGSVWLETSWAAGPFLLVLGFFGWAVALYVDAQTEPVGALEISGTAKQWMWKFSHHPGGQREINELHVPAGEPVKITLTSQDVIHSLYLPALRLKQDVLPGRYTTLSFTADRPGTYTLRCAEFCGANHSVMGGRIVVQTPRDYARWLSRSGADRSLAQRGKLLFRQYGCSGCHGPASSVKAPDLAGLYGRPVPLESGETIIADDQYIRDSILFPQRAIAAGYPPIMPTFRNVIEEEDLIALTAFIRDTRPADWREE